MSRKSKMGIQGWTVVGLLGVAILAGVNAMAAGADATPQRVEYRCRMFNGPQEGKEFRFSIENGEMKSEQFGVINRQSARCPKDSRDLEFTACHLMGIPPLLMAEGMPYDPAFSQAVESGAQWSDLRFWFKRGLDEETAVTRRSVLHIYAVQGKSHLTVILGRLQQRLLIDMVPPYRVFPQVRTSVAIGAGFQVQDSKTGLGVTCSAKIIK